jgi:hypothetical protein
VDTYFRHFYKLSDVNTATTGRLPQSCCNHASFEARLTHQIAKGQQTHDLVSFIHHWQTPDLMRFHQFQGVRNIILLSATDRVFCHTSIDPCVRGVPAGSDHVQAEVAIGYHAHQSGGKGILDDRQNSSIGFLHQQGG